MQFQFSICPGIPEQFFPGQLRLRLNLHLLNSIALKLTSARFLSDILDGAQKYLDGAEDWEKTLAVQSVYDNTSGLWITGVDVLDILAYHDTNFAGNISFIGIDETFNTTAYYLTGKMYEEDEPVILGIAADKKWLAQSPLGSQYGNFAIVGQEMNETCKQLEEIDILTNWTIEVMVNDVLNITLGPENLTSSVSPLSYSYIDTGWYNYNRTYWGKNISTIVSYTGADIFDFEVRFETSDGYFFPKGSKPAYNKTDVMEHLANNGTHIVGNHVDYVNGTGKNPADGVPMASTDMRMCLAFADQELSEGAYGDPDPVWPNRKFLGYRSGPYQFVIPGRIKARYIKHIQYIYITT